MSIEERIERLEMAIATLTEQINATQKEQWVTPQELAKIMNCSVNNIYLKIRSGEIYATGKLGAIKRIPMSQFYKNETKEELKPREKTMREKIFGF